VQQDAAVELTVQESPHIAPWLYGTRIRFDVPCQAVQARTWQCDAVPFTGVSLLCRGVCQDVAGGHAHLARDAACCACRVVVGLSPAESAPCALDSIGRATKHPGQTPPRRDVAVKAIEGPRPIGEQPRHALSGEKQQRRGNKEQQKTHSC